MHIRGDHAELVVGGRLDVRSAADARTVLHSAVDSGDGDLVLDLTELDSWDATGLGVIMGAHRRAGRCGRRLVLREVPPQMRRLLVATRLHRILAIEGAEGVEGTAGAEGKRAGAAPAAGPAGTPSAEPGVQILTKP
nr:STAS domain-containing protein [Streptomyces boncukensis]